LGEAAPTLLGDRLQSHRRERAGAEADGEDPDVMLAGLGDDRIHVGHAAEVGAVGQEHDRSGRETRPLEQRE
jgi:hypothetical protein